MYLVLWIQEKVGKSYNAVVTFHYAWVFEINPIELNTKVYEVPISIHNHKIETKSFVVRITGQ